MKLKDLEEDVELVNEASSFYVSLSDLMILLLVFFSMLLSVSKFERGAFEKVRSTFRGSTEDTLVALAEELQDIVSQDDRIHGVRVSLAQEGVRIDLDTVALFEPGRAELLPSSLMPLGPVWERVLLTRYRLDVEGHTDDVPLYQRRGRQIQSNWTLSGRRASSVIHHLLGLGFHPSRLRVVGYASTRPKTSTAGKSAEALEQARRDNRRVSVLIR